MAIFISHFHDLALNKYIHKDYFYLRQIPESAWKNINFDTHNFTLASNGLKRPPWPPVTSKQPHTIVQILMDHPVYHFAFGSLLSSEISWSQKVDLIRHYWKWRSNKSTAATSLTLFLNGSFCGMSGWW